MQMHQRIGKCVPFPNFLELQALISINEWFQVKQDATTNLIFEPHIKHVEFSKAQELSNLQLTFGGGG